MRKLLEHVNLQHLSGTSSPCLFVGAVHMEVGLDRLEVYPGKRDG